MSDIITISPATNEPIATRSGVASRSALDALAQTSLQAFQSFRKTPLANRQAIVRRALDLIGQRTDDLARELTHFMGRPIAYTAKEVSTAVLRAEYLLRISDEALADTPGDAQAGFRRYIKKEAVGPVLVIFAWNYPYLILVNSLIPAILAGNSVILKPSPQTPTVAEHAVQIFQEAGLPENVIQVLHCGSPTDLEPLLQNPSIAHVCFTGSVAGGRAVEKVATSSRIVSVGLELGGNDAAYVREDVDVAWAAEEIVDGAIFSSGQSCCAVERVYVHESIHDAFIQQVQKVLAGYRLGDPTDVKTHIGPVISKAAKKAIEAQIQDALDKGAVRATPENETFRAVSSAPLSSGNYVVPTLLTNVTADMQVMREETFGPVIPVQRVSSDEEAVRYINDSDLGLTASIWTQDVERGHELVDDIEAGTVFVNRCDFPSPDLAWTGWKNSGRGVTLSRFGFDQFVKLKSVHLKDYPKSG